MTKQIIVAICGKSASGKDTLAKDFIQFCNNKNIDAGLLISDTTRPKRVSEKDGVDYNFINEEQFKEKINNYEYMEFTYFNNWYYGTPINILKHDVNIGVFNPQGVYQLLDYSHKYNIIPIYLDCPLWVRLKHSCEREKGFKIEHIKRVFRDEKIFKDIDDILYNKNTIILPYSACITNINLLIQKLVGQKIIKNI